VFLKLVFREQNKRNASLGNNDAAMRALREKHTPMKDALDKEEEELVNKMFNQSTGNRKYEFR